MSESVCLSGKRVLVTGAASGIGLAVARAMAGAKAAVILTDVSTDPLRRAAQDIPGARAIAADLGSREAIRALVAESGEVDILVNNAGFQHVSPVESFDESRWDQMLAVLLTAPFLLTKAFIPGMYGRKWGRVINVASVHGLVASPFKSAYVSAKHGLLGFTKTIALEAAAHSPDVTVNALCPSYVRTPLVERQVADQARLHGLSPGEVMERVLLVRNASKRLIEPEEVAQSVLFLCRKEAWSITGSALTMDAGWLAH